MIDMFVVEIMNMADAKLEPDHENRPIWISKNAVINNNKKEDKKHLKRFKKGIPKGNNTKSDSLNILVFLETNSPIYSKVWWLFENGFEIILFFRLRNSWPLLLNQDPDRSTSMSMSSQTSHCMVPFPLVQILITLLMYNINWKVNILDIKTNLKSSCWR